MNEKPRVLVIDDDIQVSIFLRRLLEAISIEVALSASGEEARRMLRDQKFQLTMLDLKLPDVDGLQLLKEIKRLQPDCEVLVMTGYGTDRTAAKAVQMGAYDFLDKPFDNIDDLERVVKKAVLASAGGCAPGCS